MIKPFSIRRFRTTDQHAVETHVLAIQRNEFGLELNAGNQPDLNDITAYFSHANSAFWVAESVQDQNIIGCIGLQALPGRVAVMRKFMVHPDWRGKAKGVAIALNDTFETYAKKSGATLLILSTVNATKAAQQFYRNNGYNALANDQLPAAFIPGVLDTMFYSKAVEK